MTQHIVNISGGKDSACCYMLAIMRGKPFRAVFADTGHEHEQTYEWVDRLHDRTGGPKVEIVRADFSEQIARKREIVQTNWAETGVPDEIIQAALDVLHPTGNPFLDLCIWKCRFPSRRAQFCTECLKANPIETQVFSPIRRCEPVVSWQGERREESAARRMLPRFQRVKSPGLHDRLIFRPILHWTAQNTFALHKFFSLEPNPLYLRGARRVGCLPCINAGKEELAMIAREYPWAVERLKRYEEVVSRASRRGKATFFAPDKTPEGARLSRQLRLEAEAAVLAENPSIDQSSAEFKRIVKQRISDLSKHVSYPKADTVFEWAKTDRGGVQYSLLDWPIDEDGVACTSHYGLCE